jgi:GDPmannose 4,6-dehydratase
VRALITGVCGQDGSYLAKHLLSLGYDVTGVVRAAPRRVISGVRYVHADLLDERSLMVALYQVDPHEVYNLAAVTAPGGRWGTTQPAMLAEVTAVGVVRLLDACLHAAPNAKIVHASSSAIHDPHRYGLYGIAKRFAHDAAVGYRDRLHVSNAVLYSHTSPRQDPRFVAPTIARTLRDFPTTGRPFVLTELGAPRDWGWAPDFVKALPLIARAEPGDFDVATGELHTIADLVQCTLDALGLEWDTAVRVEPGTVAPPERPADLTATAALGWKHETPFAQMAREMVWTSPS